MGGQGFVSCMVHHHSFLCSFDDFGMHKTTQISEFTFVQQNLNWIGGYLCIRKAHTMFQENLLESRIAYKISMQMGTGL